MIIIDLLVAIVVGRLTKNPSVGIGAFIFLIFGAIFSEYMD